MRYALFLAALLVTQAAVAQTSVGTEVQAAVQQFNGGDTAGGIAALEALAEANPGNGQVLATLGNLKRQSQDFEGSLEAFTRALEINPQAAGLMYNLGLAHALLNQKDHAFDLLFQARAAGFNVLNLAGGPAAAALSDDPRYAELLPGSADYAAPFVEGTRIIHDWHGESAGDQFGWIARNVGDVDGDGVSDAVSSAPTNSEGAPSGGKIYVYSGRTGALLWTALGSDAGGQLGFGVEAGEDIDGDGTPDVLAGAPYANKAFVYSGRDGTLIHVLEGGDPTGGFGTSLRGIGDANGDGFGDLLVGEPFQIFGAPVGGGTGSEPGRAHVFSGRDGSVLLTLTGEGSGSAFGTTVAGAATPEGPLYVVGSPGAGDANRGRAYVYRGLNHEPVHVLEGADTGVNFGGMFMSVMGDANADGQLDVYVSDWSDAALGASTGRAYVFSGADGSRLLEMGGESAGDGFGIGISNAGDVDRDGHDDLVVGAWQYAGAAPSGGKLYVISGKSADVMRTITGKVMGETLGFDTTGIGDVDGDGTVDFLITSAWSSVSGFRSGRTYVLSGANE